MNREAGGVPVRVDSWRRGIGAVVALLVCAASLSAAESLQSLLDRASRLAQQKQFEAAETVSRDAVARFPRSTQAQRMLAYVLLWQGEYGEARERFARVIAANARDAEARVGLAQAYYWSGDYRGALREFERVLELQPSNAEAQRAIGEIRSAARPGYAVETSVLSDDQPYRGTGLAARAFFFTDPLTQFEVRAAGSQLRALGVSRDTTSVGVSGETSFPNARLRVRGGVDRLTFPDATAQLLPAVRVERALGKTNLALSAERRALLRSAAALRTHPSGGAVALRWSRDDDGQFQFAVRTEHIRYFDRNRGWGVDGYALLRPLRAGPARVTLGGSLAYRDTAEPRFRLRNAATLEGDYDPYHTPHSLAEARAIVAASASLTQRLTASVHVDGGIARDRVIFATTGGQPLEFGRTFYPWRASANAALQLTSGVALTVSAAHETTAFYNSNEIRAGVAGRF